MALIRTDAGVPPAFPAMPEAVARVPRELAFRCDALPLNVVDGILVVALPDPDDADVLDALRTATHLRIRALPMARDAIRDQLRRAYGDALPTPLHVAKSDAPAVHALDAVFARAVASHASDIHLEPLAAGGRVRLRIDGVMQTVDTIAADVFPALCSRLKLQAGMNIADRRQPQDGRCAIPFERREIDARVSSLPTADGEKLVVRLLDRYGAAPDLTRLGMPAAMLERFRAAARAPWGCVIVAGPTGSGKTTTLYACLSELDVAARNVCSVEDPIEMRLPGVTQVQTNARAGMTFPAVLRAFMRQDPNVIMVGEMRDRETAATALSAALAGQIVFTTLHANDAPRTIDRLVELGTPRHALAGALTAVAAQRLIRTLCERCRVEEAIPDPLRAALRTDRTSWHVARGCRACSGSGYLGRTGVYELLELDDATRDAVANGASSVQIAHAAREAGFRPLLADGVDKVLAGITSFEELARVVAWSAL
jgi:type II secretory ATPase GspE/PulE/Tfp pilus assembly ATPase PilB-like protein